MDDDLFAVEKLDEHRSLCISTLAQSTVVELGADHLGGDRGYFVYEMTDGPRGGGINILAKATSLDAAQRLIDLWRHRLRPN